MDDKQTKSISFNDSALLIATITASLFTIGYLHEAPFLEKFGLKNEEFIPSNTTLIIYGFKYVFTKLLAYTVVASIIFMLSSSVVFLVKKEMSLWIRKKFKTHITIEVKKFLIYYAIISIPFLTAIASLKIIQDGQKMHDEYLIPKNVLDIITTKRNITIYGKVIRYNNNKVAFFDINKKIAIVFPDSEIVEIKYSVNETITSKNDGQPLALTHSSTRR